MHSDVAPIQEVSARWSAAVANADIGALRDLMTEDVVVIHGNGRVVQGREAVVEDLRRSLTDLHVVQQVDSKETILAGVWAFDRADVRTTIVRQPGGEAERWDSRTITILRRDSPLRWRVARSIGVLLQNR